MNEQAMNVAIAEACGWRFEPDIDVSMKTTATQCWIPPGGADWHTQQPPNYTGDLNAMHEAEKLFYGQDGITVDASKINRYCSELRNIAVSVVHATDIQRAEAFLRTVGKWVE